MYLPRAFAETDLALLDALIERDAFVTLVTVDGDGLPFASQLPVIYRRSGDEVVLEGHWARPNPQWRHAGQALAIVHGPHAYVSASWYPDKQQAGRVPTWNYAAAHLQGRLQVFDDEARLAALVSELSDLHEARAGSDWRFDAGSDDERRKLRGVVGFRLVAERIELKAKLGQNHPQANMRAVAERLQRQGGHEAEVAAMMSARLRDAHDG